MSIYRYICVEIGDSRPPPRPYGMVSSCPGPALEPAHSAAAGCSEMRLVEFGCNGLQPNDRSALEASVLRHFDA